VQKESASFAFEIRGEFIHLPRKAAILRRGILRGVGPEAFTPEWLAFTDE